MNVEVSITDVRETAGLADYTGELNQVTNLRITDRANGTAATRAATVQDTPFAVTVPCTATPETTRGATCSLSTSMDALVPGSVPEGKRSIWAARAGRRSSTAARTAWPRPAGNSLFAVQGVFVP